MVNNIGSSNYLPNRQQVLAEVMAIVAQHSTTPVESMRETDKLEADLGCDSLDAVEIVMEVEENFDISISDEAAERASTLGAIADGVMELLPQTPRD